MPRSLLALSLACGLAACGDGRAQDDAAPPAADYSAAIWLRDAGECRFDPLTEHAFEGLLLLGGEPGETTAAPVVEIGEARLSPRLETAPMAGNPDGREYRSQVAMPGGSEWHGLPLTRLWVEFIAPPETDSLYRRGLSLAASAEEVRRVLAEQGAAVPLAPDFRELGEYAPFSAGTCGGSIYIEAEPGGGASLVCDSGC